VAGQATGVAQTADPPGQAVAAAEAAASTWLGLIDHGQYDASWDSASTLFQTAVTKAQWASSVLQARASLEPLRARKLLSASFRTELPGAPAGEYVVLQYETQARGANAVIETVTPMKERDGGWRVSGYYIRPQ
jgi:hypothetical protein